MRLRLLAALTGATLMLGACPADSENQVIRVVESNAARVDCGTPGPGGVDCQIQRTGGDSDFEACWDLVITCQNDEEMKGAACHTVPAGQATATANMPVASFSNQTGCDVPAAGRVDNLKINDKG